MLTHTLGAVVLASFLACTVTTAGIFAISRYEKWGTDNAVYFMSFAAGVLISVSFIHIIPKSFEMNLSAPLFLLAGFLALYATNRFLSAYICHEYECADYTLGIIPMLGVGLHSLIDGVIYSVTFNVSIFTGVLAAIGMVLHEFPEGIVTFLLLKRGGFNKKKSTWYAFLAAAISTPLGTLISFPVLEKIERSILGGLLAFSAGVLIYVGATHLLPAVERENKGYSFISMGAGILVAIVIVLSNR
jgi:zinc and cadmium transporter